LLSGGSPSLAARRSARALIAKDMRELSFVGSPLRPAQERALISRHWALTSGP
jgi:hypothetical protein